MTNVPGAILRSRHTVFVLSPKTKRFDQRPVAVDVNLGEVLEQPPALPDQKQQATTAVVIVRVGLEVSGEVVDPVCEQRHLNLGGTSVAFARGVGRDNFALGLTDGRGHFSGFASPALGGGLRGLRTVLRGCRCFSGSHWLSLGLNLCGPRYSSRGLANTRADTRLHFRRLSGENDVAARVSLVKTFTGQVGAPARLLVSCAPQDPTGVGDVVRDSRRELLDVVEPAHFPEPFDEIEADLFAVQVAGKIE